MTAAPYARNRTMEAGFEALAGKLLRKWQDEEHVGGCNTPARLLECLACQPLDARFEEYGNFYFPLEDGTGHRRVWGNFFTISAVFSFDGTVAELAPLVAAIRKNQASAGYAWAKAEDEQRRVEARARQAQHDAERARHPWRSL